MMLNDSLHSEIIDKGIAIGFEQGYKQGFEQGLKQGALNCYVSTITLLLENCFHKEVSQEIMDVLKQQKDLLTMKLLFVLAVKCNSMNEFYELLK